MRMFPGMLINSERPSCRVHTKHLLLSGVFSYSVHVDPGLADLNTVTAIPQCSSRRSDAVSRSDQGTD